jgi:glycosyltransferase involved in cell wall biosynthesis
MAVESITFFFPAYNERTNVGRTIEETLQVIRELAIPEWEILFVDDGSSDGTAQVIESHSVRHPSIRVVRHPVNKGYGAAVLSGIAAARGDWFFMTDADLQFRVSDVHKLLPFTTSHTFVQGYRIRRADPLGRVLLGRIYRRLAHFMFQIPVRDPECSFRLVRTSILKGLPLTCGGPMVPVELVTRAKLHGATFAEVGVGHYSRLIGKSKAVTLSALRRVIRDAITLSWSLRTTRRKAA